MYDRECECGKRLNLENLMFLAIKSIVALLHVL